MNSKGLSGGIYKPLSPEGIDAIHSASLTILEKTASPMKPVWMQR